MKRILIVLTATGLLLAPAAAAKGPHAILTTPREKVEPGKPWQFTVELNEFRHQPRPAMIGRSGNRTVGASVERTPASIEGAAGFRFTMIFPHEGRWQLRMFAGKRRFVFPAVAVGGASPPQDYVAFPIGSAAAREGAGGVYVTGEAPAVDTGDNGVLPPETIRYEDGAADGDGVAIGPWILPLLGVALAGAGVAALRRRGSRSAPRPSPDAPRRPPPG